MTAAGEHCVREQGGCRAAQLQRGAGRCRLPRAPSATPATALHVPACQHSPVLPCQALSCTSVFSSSVWMLKEPGPHTLSGRVRWGASCSLQECSYLALAICSECSHPAAALTWHLNTPTQTLQQRFKGKLAKHLNLQTSNPHIRKPPTGCASGRLCVENPLPMLSIPAGLKPRGRASAHRMLRCSSQPCCHATANR